MKGYEVSLLIIQTCVVILTLYFLATTAWPITHSFHYDHHACIGYTRGLSTSISCWKTP